MDLIDYFLQDFYKAWDRPIKETQGLRAIKDEKGYLIIANIAGIEKEDLKVELSANTLFITGETKIEEAKTKASVRYTLALDKTLVDSIEKIEVKAKNGYAYIYLITKEIKEKKIKIDFKD
jgi:HSP20 family molecular chaperone IbpA